jgi:hypothetical protein
MHERPWSVILWGALLALSLHALVTGRTISESTRELGPRTIRMLGGLGIALVVLSYFLIRTRDRILLTLALGVLLAFAGHQALTGRGRDNWGREQSPATARFWGWFVVAMVVLCLARVWR